jgi:hypothetical protein
MLPAPGVIEVDMGQHHIIDSRRIQASLRSAAKAFGKHHCRYR